MRRAMLLAILLSATLSTGGNTAEKCAPRMLRVAVIDTGLDLTDMRFIPHLCGSGHEDFTGEGLTDTVGHGTHVAGIIKAEAGDAPFCLQILKFYSAYADGMTNLRREIQALRVARGADIVNLSIGGPEFSEPELLALKAIRGKLVAAAGNEGNDLAIVPYYPASYGLPNMIVVGNGVSQEGRFLESNYGRQVNVWEWGKVDSTLPGGRRGIMIGTSQATAVQTGKLIQELALHPQSCAMPPRRY